MKIGITYYSATGNTERMAEMLEALLETRYEVEKVDIPDMTAEKASRYDILALGCPAMGDEVLEEMEFEPMIAGLENSLTGRKLILFGSYGWGDGEWMRAWKERMEMKGATVLGCVIVQGQPDNSTEYEFKKIIEGL